MAFFKGTELNLLAYNPMDGVGRKRRWNQNRG